MAKNDKKEAIKATDSSKSSISAKENDVKVADKVADKKENSSSGKESLQNNRKSHKGLFFTCFLFCLLATTSGAIYFDLVSTKKMQSEFNAKLLADYSNEFAKLNQRIDAQQEEIIALRNMPAPEISEVQYESILQSLQSRLQNYDTSNNAKPNEDIKAEIKNVADDKISAEVLLASGAMVVRGLADSGQTFVYESEILQILAQNNETAENYVATIKQYANSGIKGKAMLISEFNKIYADLSQPQTEEPAIDKTQNWQERFMNGLKNLVVMKKPAPKKVSFPKQTDKAWQLVNLGNFAEALNLINTDKKYSSVKSAELTAWINQVNNHLDFERAVNGLIINSLANLRLKELSLPQTK